MSYLIILSMQANCLIFPSPSKYTLEQQQIVLIPREPDNNLHLPYTAQYSSEVLTEVDQLSEWLASHNNHHPKRILRDSTVTNCDKRMTNDNSLEGNLQLRDKVDATEYIPCLFIPGKRKKIILFFHANGEDITSAYEFLRMVNFQSHYSILAMEYRGYSLYKGDTTPANIQEDANRVVSFLMANKLTAGQIIVFGRSIGCAVALTVTEKFSVHCAVLLSPFISLKKVAHDLYGRCASLLLKEAFNNEQNCKLISCPVLVIHGEKDTLVPFEHSMALISGCQAYCRLKIIENMTHTKFNFRMDFIRHFKQFLSDIE